MSFYYHGLSKMKIKYAKGLIKKIIEKQFTCHIKNKQDDHHTLILDKAYNKLYII